MLRGFSGDGVLQQYPPKNRRSSAVAIESEPDPLAEVRREYRPALRIGPGRSLRIQYGSASTLTSFLGFFHTPDFRLSLHSGTLHDLL